MPLKPPLHDWVFLLGQCTLNTVGGGKGWTLALQETILSIDMNSGRWVGPFDERGLVHPGPETAAANSPSVSMRMRHTDAATYAATSAGSDQQKNSTANPTSLSPKNRDWILWKCELVTLITQDTLSLNSLETKLVQCECIKGVWLLPASNLKITIFVFSFYQIPNRALPLNTYNQFWQILWKFSPPLA